MERYEHLLEEASKLDEENKIEESIMKYYEAIDLKPKELAAWEGLFNVYYMYKYEDKDKILELSKNILAIDINHEFVLEEIFNIFLERNEESKAVWVSTVLYRMNKQNNSFFHSSLDYLKKMKELLDKKITSTDPFNLNVNLPNVTAREISETIKEIQDNFSEEERIKYFTLECLKTFGTKLCKKCGEVLYVGEDTCRKCYEFSPIKEGTLLYKRKAFIRQDDKFLISVYYEEIQGKESGEYIPPNPRFGNFYDDYLFFIDDGKIKWKKNLQSSIIKFLFNPKGDKITVITSFQIDDLIDQPLIDLMVFRRKFTCNMCENSIVKGTPCWRGHYYVSRKENEIEFFKGQPNSGNSRICLNCLLLNENRNIPLMFHAHQFSLEGELLQHLPILRPEKKGTIEPFYTKTDERAFYLSDSLDFMKFLQPFVADLCFNLEHVNENEVVLSIRVYNDDDHYEVKSKINININQNKIKFS